MLRTLTTWLSCFAVMVAVNLRADQGAKADDRAPVRVTVLQTVNLPWQAPEVIVSAAVAVRAVQVEMRVDKSAVQTRVLGDIAADASRSATWEASPGVHACRVKIVGESAAGPFAVEQNVQVEVVPPIEVTLSPADVDLERRNLRFKANVVLVSAELALYGVDGRTLHRATHNFEAQSSAPSLTWPPLSDAVARVTLRVFSSGDSWAEAEWHPIEIELMHAPIMFAGTASTVAATERAKLDALASDVRKAAGEHHDARGLKLYVLGLGSSAAQIELSSRRAQEIARYLRHKASVVVPILSGAVIEPDFAVADGSDLQFQYILSTRSPASVAWNEAR